MSKTIACIIARTVSTRLPLKVLRTVTPGYSMIDFIIERLKLVKNIDDIYLCTSKEKEDEILQDVAEKNGIKIYRGSADEVIERMITVGEKEKADSLIRVTGDNVFNSYEFMDELIAIHNNNGLDYSRLVKLPFGATPEIMSLKGLKDCATKVDPKISEYMTLFMFLPNQYKCGVVKIKGWEDLSGYTLSVDHPLDLERTHKVLQNYTGNKLNIRLKDVVEIIRQKNVPGSVVSMEGEVKLPYGKIVSFVDFIKDLSDRAAKSHQFEITA